MAMQVHRPAWKSRGWMSFTVANGGVLHLGGASQTAPTAQMSNGLSGATSFLATGIPQNTTQTGFADVAKSDDTNGHSIKHALITFVSDGGTTPSGRTMKDGSVPTTSLGAQTLTGDQQEIHNSREQLFNYKWFNRSGNNAVVEVEVYE